MSEYFPKLSKINTYHEIIGASNVFFQKLEKLKNSIDGQNKTFFIILSPIIGRYLLSVSSTVILERNLITCGKEFCSLKLGAEQQNLMALLVYSI